MTAQEKIDVIAAQERGDEIEVSTIGANEWRPPRAGTSQFNFSHWDYRVKPKMNIDDLARRHHVHIDDIHAVAALAKTHHYRMGRFMKFSWGNDQGERMDVTIHGDGSVDYGCQRFTWRQIDAYARGKGWWGSRILQLGDEIQTGDEWSDNDGLTWHLVGFRLGNEKLSNNHTFLYRRPA